MPMQGLKERTCARCGKSYQPTGSTQKICPDCKVVVKKEKASEYRSAHKKTDKSAGVAGKIAAVKHPPCGINDATVLAVLIAAGLVSQETVQKAKDIVAKLRS